MGMVMFVIVKRGRFGTRQELSDSRAFLDKGDSKASPTGLLVGINREHTREYHYFLDSLRGQEYHPGLFHR